MAAFFAYWTLLSSYDYMSPIKYLLLLFLVPMYSFVAMPIMTLLGVFDFKSELLFVQKDAKKRNALHFGSFFDCLMSGMFWDKKYSFRNRMLISLLEGLIEIAREVENGKIKKEEIIIGSSYFFKESTAKKLGFTLTDLQTSHKYILYSNYIEILFIYSMTHGKLRFPNFSTFKTVQTTGEELVRSRGYIETLLARLK